MQSLVDSIFKGFVMFAGSSLAIVKGSPHFATRGRKNQIPRSRDNSHFDGRQFS